MVHTHTKTFTRSLPEAQDAFEEGNAEQSRLAHSTAPSFIQEQGHASYAVEFSFRLFIQIMGDTGMRSALISLAFISCAAFVHFPSSNLSFVRFAASILFCSGLANALITYVTKKTEIQFYNREKSREAWECRNYLEGEKKEMVELYLAKSKNLSRADATDVMEKLSTDADLFVDIMMVEELGLLNPLARDLKPLPKAALAFIGWIACGAPAILVLAFSSTSTMEPSSLEFNLAVATCALVVHAIGQSQKMLRLTPKRGRDVHFELFVIVLSVLLGSYVFGSFVGSVAMNK